MFKRKYGMYLGLIYVVIIPFVRSTDGHDDEILSRVKTEIVDRRLKLFGIFFESLLQL